MLMSPSEQFIVSNYIKTRTKACNLNIIKNYFKELNIQE